MSIALKKLTINFNYSYLVIAKSTIIKEEYSNIEKTLFADFKKIK